MIPRELEEMFFEDSESLLIPAKDVGVLRTEHQLIHAMMMLTTSFNKLPVLDDENRVQGALTIGTIMKAATSNTEYDLDLLNGKKVKDILEDSIGTIHQDFDMETLLRELQDGNFICVVDDDRKFVGIITRKEVMARVNRCFHTIQKNFELLPRTKEESVADEKKDHKKKRILSDTAKFYTGSINVY